MKSYQSQYTTLNIENLMKSMLTFQLNNYFTSEVLIKRAIHFTLVMIGQAMTSLKYFIKCLNATASVKSINVNKKSYQHVSLTTAWMIIPNSTLMKRYAVKKSHSLVRKQYTGQKFTMLTLKQQQTMQRYRCIRKWREN